jgi:two-component system, chemotaxis family, protein-glutamate methylesterase/glutaminase
MDFKIIVIGSSMGGISALRVILSNLPKDFPLPIAVVQHRAKDSGDILSDMLGLSAHFEVIEVEDKTPIVPGRLFLAPAGYHLLVERGRFALSTEDAVVFAQPSIDVLFESAADAYAEKTIGVILTGASDDGSKGLAAIKQSGGLTIVQDPATAEAPLMPKAAIAATKPDMILPLEEIGTFLKSVAGKGPKPRPSK